MLSLRKKCGLVALASFSLFVILIATKSLFDSILVVTLHKTACERIFHPLFFTSISQSGGACQPLMYNNELCKHIEAQEAKLLKSTEDKSCSQLNVKSAKNLLSCNESKCDIFSEFVYPTFCSYLQMVNPALKETDNSSKKLINKMELQEFVSFIYKKKDCGLENDGFCIIQCFSSSNGMDIDMYNIKLEGLHNDHNSREQTFIDIQPPASLNIIYFQGLSRAQFFRRFRRTINALENSDEKLLDFIVAQSSRASLNDALFLQILESLSEQDTIIILPQGILSVMKDSVPEKLTSSPSKFFTFYNDEMSNMLLQRPIKRSCTVQIQNKYVLETFKVLTAYIDQYRFSHPVNIISLLNPRAEISVLDEYMAEVMEFHKTHQNGVSFLLSNQGSLKNVANSVYSRLELSNPMLLALVPPNQVELIVQLESITKRLISPVGVTGLIKELSKPSNLVDLNLMNAANCQNMDVIEPFLCVCQNEPVAYSNNSINALFASLLLSKHYEEIQDIKFNGLKQKYIPRTKLSGLKFGEVKISYINNELHLTLQVTAWNANLPNNAALVPIIGRLVVKDTHSEITAILQDAPNELFTDHHYTTDSRHLEHVLEIGHFHVTPVLQRMHSDCLLLIIHNYIHSVLYEAANMCHYESYKVTFIVTSQTMMTSRTTEVIVYGMDVKTVGYAACLVQVHVTIPRVSYEYQISQIN